MSQSGAERRIKQALVDTEELSPEGSGKAQEQSGATYISIPKDLTDHHHITQGTDLQRAYHPATSTLLISLDGPIFEV